MFVFYILYYIFLFLAEIEFLEFFVELEFIGVESGLFPTFGLAGVAFAADEGADRLIDFTSFKGAVTLGVATLFFSFSLLDFVAGVLVDTRFVAVVFEAGVAVVAVDVLICGGLREELDCIGGMLFTRGLAAVVFAAAVFLSSDALFETVVLLFEDVDAVEVAALLLFAGVDVTVLVEDALGVLDVEGADFFAGTCDAGLLVTALPEGFLT
jgi:hypothetical protein